MFEHSEKNDPAENPGGRASHVRREDFQPQDADNAPPGYTAEFRFYGILNDFLPAPRQQRTNTYRFQGHPGVKDPIEALGIPHTEVDLILVHGHPVDFAYRLGNGDRVAVYPPFGALDIRSLARLREPPPCPPRFIIDVNLGKLARRLRWLGYDSLFRNDYRDSEIADITAGEQRIVLTRDRRLLHIGRIVHGYWVRSVQVEEQVVEVARRYGLDTGHPPFTRCMVCNGRLVAVDKAAVWDELEPKTRLYYEHFLRCEACRRLYWEGSHVEHMRRGPSIDGGETN